MKKIIFIAFTLISIFSFSQVESIENTEPGEEILVEVTEVDEEDVQESSYNVNSYNSNTNSVDIVTGTIQNTLLIFKGRNTSLYGLKDKNGKVLVKPIFYSIEHYSSTKDRIIASLKNYNNKGVINQKGDIIIPFEYSSIYKNSNFFKATKDNLVYLFDFYGNSILNKPYEGIQFYNNQFTVLENGLYGILNPNGEELLPIEYDKITYYENKDWFLVVKNGISNFINSNGENIFGEKYTSVSIIDRQLEYLLVEKNGKFGIINNSGKEITPSIFDAINPNYDDSRFIVKQKGKWGVYDIYFKKFLIEPNYDDIKKLSKGYYLLSPTNQKILHNLKLNTKIDLSKFEKVDNYISNDLILKVENNNLFGFLNLETGLEIPQKYKNVYSNSYSVQCNIPNSNLSDIYKYNGELLFKNARIKSFNSNYSYKKIIVEGKVGVLKKDKILIDINYDLIKDFKGVQYVFVKSDKKNGLISLIDGKFIIPLNTDTISMISDKNIIIWKNKKYRITFNKLIEIK